MCPRQGQSQRLVSQCLPSLTTYNSVPFCFGRCQSAPQLDGDSKSLAWPAEAMGVLSALMRSHHKGEWTQHCSFFPQHLEKAGTSRSINSLREPRGHRLSCLPRGMLAVIHSITQMYPLHLSVFLPRHEPRDFNSCTSAFQVWSGSEAENRFLLEQKCLRLHDWIGQKWVYTKVFNTPQGLADPRGAPSTQQFIKPQYLASTSHFYIKQKCPHLQEKHFLKE